ncbi:torsin-1A-like [Engraulis encrasicolus]|uniref:torsin-1A-like n=1 Tax=Engraulis encrasicolus TaxID=184585 RepID=UPI002FCEDFC9
MAHMCRILLHWFLITGCIVEAIEPISVAIGAGVTAIIGGLIEYNRPRDEPPPLETCDDSWIKSDPSNLEQALTKRLFGQHIASRLILKMVTGNMNNPNPDKPLVLSLHGWSGTGKNFVAQMIAESIYYEGLESKFVHVVSATKHFPHQNHLETYKDWLQERVENSVRNCPRSLFIFDEMDKIQPDLIDSIKPHLDYHNNLDGVSYRKAIFLFLSNSGGQIINEVALDFRNNGRDREEIQLEDLETPVSLWIFNNNQSAFFRASVIDKNLVDALVPFLPLEFKHVVQCVLAAMESRGIEPDQNVAKRMAQAMTHGSIYSTQGCKTISNRLEYYI